MIRNTNQPPKIYDEIPEGENVRDYRQGYAYCVSFFDDNKIISPDGKFLNKKSRLRKIKTYAFIDTHLTDEKGMCTAYFIFYDEFEYELYAETLYIIADLIQPLGKVIFHKDFLTEGHQEISWRDRYDTYINLNKHVLTFQDKQQIALKYKTCFWPGPKKGWCVPTKSHMLQMSCERKCPLNKRYGKNAFDRACKERDNIYEN